MTEERSEGPAAEAVGHWRVLRESLEPRIRRLEADLRGFRWEHAVGIGGHVTAAERSYERLLRLRRLHSKLVSRERLAAGRPAADPFDLRRA